MSQYRLIFTNIGLSKKQNAELNNNYIQITEFAVGSGNIVNLLPTMTGLLVEEHRANINNVDTKNGTTIFDLIIPSNIGGFWIKEVALFDIDGDCICIGTVPITYKVNQDEGASKAIHLKVSTTSTNTENIVFNTDDSLVYATVSYVNDHINDKTNPHEVTKEQLGLENVDNTADSEKNVASAGNAFKLDGKTLEELKSIFFPKGIISKWCGAIAAIPLGWALCDGSNGTPDLRDKFIVGASGDNSGISNTSITGSNTRTGGSKDAIVVSHTHTQAAHAHSQAAHTHGDYGHTHSAWTDGQGNHAHTTQGHVSINKFFYSGGGGNDGTGIPYSAAGWTSEGGHHSHNVGIAAGYANLATATPAIHEATPAINSTGSNGVNANLPPYFALAFIMKL